MGRKARKTGHTRFCAGVRQGAMLALSVSFWLWRVDALAQSSADASNPAPSSDVVHRIPDVLATAVEPAEPREDPSSFGEVIRVEDYRGEVTSTEELLSRAVGVQVRRFGGPGGPAELSIRGSTSSQVAVLLDGVRLDTAQSGTVDLSTIPLALLDRIEITRGGGGAQAGSSAMGGVVNLITLRPGGPPRNRLVATAGSFDTYQVSAARAATAAGLEYVLGYDGFRTRGDWGSFERFARRAGGLLFLPDPEEAERINNEAERHSLLVGLGHDLLENGHLSWTNSLVYESRGMPGLDAGSVRDAGQRAEAHRRRFRSLSSLRYRVANWQDSGFDSQVELAYLHERVRFRDPEVVPRLGTSIETDDRNGSLTGRWSLDTQRELSFSQHALSGLFEYRRDTLDSNSFADQRRNTTAFAFQDAIDLFGHSVRLFPAVRWEHTEDFGSEWLPRIGLLLEPWAGVVLKANLEKAYRVPNFDELFFPDEGFVRGNPALRPESSMDGDVGLELRFARLGPLRAGFFEVAWFRREIDDSIVWVLLNQSIVEPRNTGAATVRGYEITGSVSVSEWLQVSANHTHLDATLDRTGTALPGRADKETNLRWRFGPPDGLGNLVVEMQRTGEIPVSDTGATRLPSRTVWDATFSFRPLRLPGLRGVEMLRDLIVSVEGKNLTDENIRDAEFFPQPGRAFYVRVEGEW